MNPRFQPIFPPMFPKLEQPAPPPSPAEFMTPLFEAMAVPARKLAEVGCPKALAALVSLWLLAGLLLLPIYLLRQTKGEP